MDSPSKPGPSTGAVPVTNVQPTTATQPVPERKRRRLGLQLSIETGADGKVPIQQVFSDGSYIPAVDSHFERTSAAASAFVARALAAPAPGSSSIETIATDSHDAARSWSAKFTTSVEGAIYEAGRFIGVIEALRASPPVLELKRTAPRTMRQGDAASEIAEREGEGMLMTKRRMATTSADFLDSRVKAMEKWIQTDSAFCDAFLTMRKKCGGVRRLPNGTPMIDIGDGEFVHVLRPKERRISTTERDVREPEELLPSQRLPRINFRAATYLKFGISSLSDQDVAASTAPVMLDQDRGGEDQSMTSVVRRIRLSRVSAFRRKTFEQMAEEAAELPILTEITTNTFALESGPKDLVRVEKTQRGGSAPSLDAGADSATQVVEDMPALQNASLLQIVSTQSCLKQALNVSSKPVKILDRVLAATSSRSVVDATEKVLDDAVNMLRVRLEWTRGVSRVEEARVRVFSTNADGDGPERALATIEPISTVSNGGNESHNGHVRITPAFGVIISAPDDPSVRGRAVTSHHSSSSGTASSAMGFDDVPRSYVCPVGGEVLSVLTLLLCIRLLDALETAARSGEEEMLDVDRQCFTVIVSAPTNGHTLKAKVWPRGSGVGEEVPGSTAWFNGQRIQSFPAVGPGRVAAWKQLLGRLVAGDMKIASDATDVKPVQEDVLPKEEGVPAKVEARKAAKDSSPVAMNIVNAVAMSRAQTAGPASSGPAQAGQFPFQQAPPENRNQFQFDL